METGSNRGQQLLHSPTLSDIQLNSATASSIISHALTAQIMSTSNAPDVLSNGLQLQLRFTSQIIDEGDTLEVMPASLRPHHTAMNTGCLSMLPLVNDWLNECKTIHVECQRYSSKNSIMPTRLVDLTSGGDSLRIHRTVSGQRLKYVALSHCWGSTVDFLKLEARNYVHLRN